MLLVWEELQLDVGVAGTQVGVLGREVSAADHRDDEGVLVVLVPGINFLTNVWEFREGVVTRERQRKTYQDLAPKRQLSQLALNSNRNLDNK